LLSDKIYQEVIVFYFHRTERCTTCKAIEADTDRIIKIIFAQQLAEGTLKWIPFNLDDEGGEELRKQFDINSSTLLVAKVINGDYVKHKKLEKVWELVGKKEDFSRYVIDEINMYLSDE
jgi:hypothetical protein